MQQVQMQATTIPVLLCPMPSSTGSYVGAATSPARPYALLDFDDRLLKDIGRDAERPPRSLTLQRHSGLKAADGLDHLIRQGISAAGKRCKSTH
jgi:hypothetical protein